jgi:CBS domain containing-hemolysin-like protein
MIPISEYATVPEDACLREAVLALETAQDQYEAAKKIPGRHRYKHRAVVVLDENHHLIGKLSMWDIIKALEPEYDKIGDFSSTAKFGFSASFIRSIVKKQGLWTKPLDNLCHKASSIKVKDIMYTPDEGEFLDADASLDEAIHLLIMGHHQSMLVTSGKEKKIIGVLRLTDVFEKICDLIKKCGS